MDLWSTRNKQQWVWGVLLLVAGIALTSATENIGYIQRSHRNANDALAIGASNSRRLDSIEVIENKNEVDKAVLFEKIVNIEKTTTEIKQIVKDLD